jgi:2-oxoglutarate ferredoxin oxidoreductase subunit gamma
MKETLEILLGGTGGQGLGLAGVILAQAFAEEEGRNVLETEAYGISMRGGMSRAEVLVSREEINEIRANNPDVLVALSQPVADIYVPRAREGAVIVLDSLLVAKPADAPAGVFLLPLTEAARKLGMEAAANIVDLGAIASLAGIPAKESLSNILRKKFGRGVIDLNLKALDAGYEMGQQAKSTA